MMLWWCGSVPWGRWRGGLWRCRARYCNRWGSSLGWLGRPSRSPSPCTEWSTQHSNRHMTIRDETRRDKTRQDQTRLRQYRKSKQGKARHNNAGQTKPMQLKKRKTKPCKPSCKSKQYMTKQGKARRSEARQLRSHQGRGRYGQMDVEVSPTPKQNRLWRQKYTSHCPWTQGTTHGQTTSMP